MNIIKHVNGQESVSHYPASLFKAKGWLAGGVLCGFFVFGTNVSSAQTVADGLKLVEIEQSGKAIQLFNKLISSNPKDASLYYYRGYTYIQRDKLDSAMADFNQGISVNAKEGLNYAGKGYVLLDQNKVQEGEAAFDQALQISKSKKVNVLNAVADAYLNAESKNLVKAKTLLERAVTLDEGKTNPQTYQLLGDAFLMENNGGKAVSNYERAADLNKTWPKPYYSIGKVFARGRNYPLSLENFQKAISIDPNYAPAYKDLGELYYRTNQVQKAKDAYAKYLEISEIRGASTERYAAFLFLSKDYPGAIREINNALSKNPDNMVMNRLLGYSTYETGDYGTSIKSMEKFFQVAKQDKILASDYGYLGKALVAANCDSLGLQNCDSLGITNLRKAIEMDTTETSMDYRKAIAEAYKDNKRYKEAGQELQAVIDQKTKANPNDRTLAADYFDIGKMYLQAEQYVEADSSFSRVTRIFPDQWTGYYFKAMAESNIDVDQKQALAKPTYERLIEVINNDQANKDRLKKYLIPAYRYLGSYYLLVANDKQQALANLNKVLEIDPTNQQAKEAIDAITKGPKPSAKPGAKPGAKPSTTKGGTAAKTSSSNSK